MPLPHLVAPHLRCLHVCNMRWDPRWLASLARLQHLEASLFCVTVFGRLCVFWAGVGKGGGWGMQVHCWGSRAMDRRPDCPTPCPGLRTAHAPTPSLQRTRHAALAQLPGHDAIRSVATASHRHSMACNAISCPSFTPFAGALYFVPPPAPTCEHLQGCVHGGIRQGACSRFLKGSGSPTCRSCTWMTTRMRAGCPRTWCCPRCPRCGDWFLL